MLPAPLLLVPAAPAAPLAAALTTLGARGPRDGLQATARPVDPAWELLVQSHHLLLRLRLRLRLRARARVGGTSEGSRGGLGGGSEVWVGLS